MRDEPWWGQVFAALQTREGTLCVDDTELKQLHFALPFNHQVPIKFFLLDCIKGILKDPTDRLITN
jgi:hypothetical protein